MTMVRSAPSTPSVLAFILIVVDMVNRLNNLVPSNTSSYPGMGNMSMPMSFTNPSPFGSSNGGSYSSGMSHMPIPGQQQMQMPEIRSEADLAVFNQFMMSLGRDAANHMPHPMAHGASYDSNSGSSSSPLSTESPIEDLFNPDELASLGLGNMPGMASSLPTDLGLSNTQPYGHMYPSLPGMDLPRHRTASSSELDMSKRPIAALPRSHSVATKGNNGYPSAYALDPPAYADVSDYGHGDYANPMPNDYSSFDSLARSKNAMPSATMAPRDFYKKTYRHVAPLGAAVSSRQSALRESSERTEMDDDDDEDDQSAGDMTPKISVRSLLVDEEDIDPALRLPAIASRQHGSMSIPSLHDSHLDVYTRSSETHLPTKRHTEDELTGGVKRLELADREYSSSRSPEASESPRRVASTDHVKELRRRHTALIKSWIVAVNIGFKRRQAEEAARHMGMDEEDELREEREGSEVSTPMTPRAAEILA